jgi:hypothetical protein
MRVEGCGTFEIHMKLQGHKVQVGIEKLLNIRE